MSEGEPVARTPSFQCPDCRVVMEPIKLLDATEPGWQREGTAHVELHYAAPDARRSFFNGHVPPLGQVYGRICPVCGRIQLYGIVAPRSVVQAPEVNVPVIRPRPRTTPPLNLVTRPPENDTPPIDPPQPIASAPRWDPVAPSWRTEPETPPEPSQPAVVLEWYVETIGESNSREGFESEKAAEAHAREQVRRNETARVFVVGPRGRRYRVLP